MTDNGRLTGNAGKAPQGGKAKETAAPKAEQAPVPVVDTGKMVDDIVNAIMRDERLTVALASAVASRLPDMVKAALADMPPPPVDLLALVGLVVGDERFPAIVDQIVAARHTDILANPDFVQGVEQLMTARLATDDFATQIRVPIDGYLDKNLPELVAAAMPETPEKAAARQAKAAARAQDERERADRKAAREREEAAEAERAAREERKAGARERRASIYSGKADAEPVDLAKVKRGTLALDDGDHLSIDFTCDIEAGQLVAVDGNTLLLQSRQITLGEGMPEGFAVDAVLLVLDMEEGHRVLRCPMPSPVLVGGGATAQLGENSLSFRPI